MLYYNSNLHSSSYEFGRQLYEFVASERNERQPLIFLCIGSDRATGDSLGPIVGHRLAQHPMKSVYVYGTLKEPVHAKNLQDILSLIRSLFPNPYIIAVDASLGKAAHIGYYTLAQGTLKPGAGVGKQLPCVGNLYITGIVNLSGFLEHSLLQTTRLHTVVSLADRISAGILYCLGELERKRAV